MFHRAVVTHRFFFALKPPPLLARQIASAAHWFEAGGAVAADRLHITTFIVDDRPRYPAALAATLTAVGAGLAAAPVPVTLDRAAGSARSIALRPSRALPALADLHRALAAACTAEGVTQRAGYRFSPHLTLGYRDGAPFTAAVAPVAWLADEIVLIHSRVGQTRHALLGRWPLRAAAADDAQLALF